MVASSEQQRAPVIVNNPATAHARSNQPGAPLSRDDSAEVMKMPEPIIEPITIIVASIGPSARTSPGPRGAGPPPGRSGPTVRPGARRLHRRGTSTPLEHQIIDRSAIRPHLTGLDEPGPNRVLLNVMPFLSVIFTRSKVPIKIFRLPDGRFDRECCCNPSRTYALPHLHPVRYAPCADFRPRKEMHMIGHDNIIAHPPAVMIGRALPDIMENLLAARRSKNFASLISARCTKDNRVVAERRYICQMAKWSWPALGPHKRSSVRGRAVSMIALV